MQNNLFVQRKGFRARCLAAHTKALCWHCFCPSHKIPQKQCGVYLLYSVVLDKNLFSHDITIWLPTNGLAKPLVGFYFCPKNAFGSYMGIIVRRCKFSLLVATFRKIKSVGDRVKGFYAVLRESVTVNVQRG